MPDVLVVAANIPLRDLVADALETLPDTAVMCTTSALVGALRARQRRFDLAIIAAALVRVPDLRDRQPQRDAHVAALRAGREILRLSASEPAVLDRRIIGRVAA